MALTVWRVCGSEGSVGGMVVLIPFESRGCTQGGGARNIGDLQGLMCWVCFLGSGLGALRLQGRKRLLQTECLLHPL